MAKAKKLKKHQQKTIIKISAVLFIACLIISLVFSARTISTEKNAQLKIINNDLKNITENIRNISPANYNSMFEYVDRLQTHTDQRSTGKLTTEITCGADGYYDNNQQIILLTTDISGVHILTNSSEEIYAGITTKTNNNTYEKHYGKLSYSQFVNSITEEQLNGITEHLRIKADDSGNYYAIQLSQAYYNHRNGQIIPKTIELVKTNDSYTSSALNEVIETYELSPENTENLKLYTLSSDCTSIIPGQFITNEYRPVEFVEPSEYDGVYLYEYIHDKYYDPKHKIEDTTYYGGGTVVNNSPFSFLYVGRVTNVIKTLGYEGSYTEAEYLKAKNEFISSLDEETINDKSKYQEAYNSFLSNTSLSFETIHMEYAKRVNVFQCARRTLLVGNCFIFLFFLIVTLIIITSMYKVMQTQFSEEKKRNELTNALAHDIKTPLFIISGYAQNLKENVNTDKRDHYCDRIIDKTQEVNNLIHRMLDFSRIGSLDKLIDIDKVDITYMTKNIISSYERLPDNKSFVLYCTDNCIINADKDLMYHSISNLIANAVTYADKESEISIEITENSFSISNECSSIFQSDIKHLTEPYYRVEKSRSKKGNGLGLSIVKSIADLHSHKLNIRLKNITITFTLDFS